MAGRDSKDSVWRKGGTVGAGLIDGTGRERESLSTRRNGKQLRQVGSRRDGTARVTGRWNYRSDGTGQKFRFDDDVTVPSRPCIAVNTVQSINPKKKKHVIRLGCFQYRSDNV